MNATMDIAWVASALWLAVTAGAVVSAAWLVVRVFRSDRPRYGVERYSIR